jgi:hypothetical protein
MTKARHGARVLKVVYYLLMALCALNVLAYLYSLHNDVHFAVSGLFCLMLFLYADAKA